MNPTTTSKTLKLLKGRDLAAITFLRGYIQLLFDGPVLNAYTLPLVTMGNTTLKSDMTGYRDALCGQIGKTVAFVREEHNDQLALLFEDGTTISISLKDEDRVCAEAAMLQADSGKHWNVW